jgi:hypothetical protein
VDLIKSASFPNERKPMIWLLLGGVVFVLLMECMSLWPIFFACALTLAISSTHKVAHCSRNRIAGSTAKARRAGAQQASRPKSSIVKMTPASTAGSPGPA